MATLEFEKELVKLREDLEMIRADSGYKGDREARISELEFELKARTTRVFAELTPWDKVQLARHPDRPHALDFMDLILTDFVEMHGDRHFGDDPAVVGGPAKLARRETAAESPGRKTRMRARPPLPSMTTFPSRRHFLWHSGNRSEERRSATCPRRSAASVRTR